jgi:hypothetical protein
VPPELGGPDALPNLVSAAGIPATGPATSVAGPVRSEVGVLLVEQVALVAPVLGPLPAASLPTGQVLGPRDRLQVTGPDAGPHPAEVVQIHTVRDRPHLQLIDEPVSCLGRRAVMLPEPAIPVPRDVAGPQPASVPFLDLGPEAGNPVSPRRGHGIDGSTDNHSKDPQVKEVDRCYCDV